MDPHSLLIANPQACAYGPTQIKVLNELSSGNKQRKMDVFGHFVIMERIHWPEAWMVMLCFSCLGHNQFHCAGTATFSLCHLEQRPILNCNLATPPVSETKLSSGVTAVSLTTYNRFID